MMELRLGRGASVVLTDAQATLLRRMHRHGAGVEAIGPLSVTVKALHDRRLVRRLPLATAAPHPPVFVLTRLGTLAAQASEMRAPDIRKGRARRAARIAATLETPTP